MKKELGFPCSILEPKAKKQQECEINPSQQALQCLSIPNTTSKKVDKTGFLLQAAKKGRLKSVKSLVKEGVNIESKTAWGGTPLYIAVSKKHFSIVKFLLAAGADPNHGTNMHDSPLNVAMGFVNIELAMILINGGANIEQVNPAGDRPLHTAAKYNSAVLIENLLIRGADIEAKSHDGLTSFEIAIKHMNVAATKILAWYGANITHQNTYDAIANEITVEEGIIVDTCRVANITTLLFTFPLQIEELNTELYDMFMTLSNHGRDLVFNRLLHQFFRNKMLSLKEVQAISNYLISTLDYVITKFNLSVFDELQDLLDKFNKDIDISSCCNEIGSVPSLLKLSASALQKKGLSLKQIAEKSCQDIADKTEALERVEDFFSNLCLKLKAEAIAPELAHATTIGLELNDNNNDHDGSNMSTTGDLIEFVG